jgi:hypothetical protein
MSARTRLWSLAWVVVASACNGASSLPEKAGGVVASCPKDGPISIAKIAVDSEQLSGCSVSIIGWFHSAETSSVCLSESDAKIENGPNCVTIGSYAKPELRLTRASQGRAVLLFGKFTASKTLIVGSPGDLDEINIVTDVTDPPTRRGPSQ